MALCEPEATSPVCIDVNAMAGGATYTRSTDLIVANSTISGCNATRGGAVYVASGSASLARSNISNCIATESGGGLYNSFGGSTSLSDSTLISGCSALSGGGLYSAGGSTSLSDGTLISGCSALSGGGLYSAGGSTSLSDGALIRGCSAEGQGNSVFLLAGEVSYTLPAPAGRWLPNARCEVYRKACSYSSSQAAKQACLEHRSDCALTESLAIDSMGTLIEITSEEKRAACRGKSSLDKEEACLKRVAELWYCQAPTVVQPCNWDSTRGGDPSLLGDDLYQLPLLPLDEDFPFACAAGLRGSIDPTNQSSSACGGLCPPGTASAEGTGSCLECEPGTYAANRGQGECIPCPYPLASGTGSVTCSVCKAKFYLKASVDPDDVFKSPTEYCWTCPSDAVCPVGTTLETLVLPPGHWRASPNSTILYPCRNFGGGDSSGEVRCAGGALAGTNGDGYCAPEFTGPECQLCADENQYLVNGDNCVDCPARGRKFLGPLLLWLGFCVAVGVAAYLYKKQSWRERRYIGPPLRLTDRMVALHSLLGMQAKLKLLLSFYQVVTVIPSIYGVTLPQRYTNWLDGITEVISPSNWMPIPCVTYTQLLLPYVITPLGLALSLLLLGVGMGFSQWHALPAPRPPPLRAVAAGLIEVLPATLVLAYCSVPPINAYIFRFWRCKMYVWDDIHTYGVMVEQPSIFCASDEYDSIFRRYIIGSIVIWPVGSMCSTRRCSSRATSRYTRSFTRR